MPSTLDDGINFYLEETLEDLKAPQKSRYEENMNVLKSTAFSLNENMDCQKSELQLLGKSLKSFHRAGLSLIGESINFISVLERMGNSARKRDFDVEVGDGFLKFAFIFREISNLLNSMFNDLGEIVLFPLEKFLKTDVKGSKGEFRRPIEKSLKEYENKLTKLRDEKRKVAREHGTGRFELTGSDIAEELEKERHRFQLHMSEYYMKVDLVRSRHGIDMIAQLIQFYLNKCRYVSAVQSLLQSELYKVEELDSYVKSRKPEQDARRKDLRDIRDRVKSKLHFVSNKAENGHRCNYSIHQEEGNKVYGYEKSGFLHKKSEGLRKVWQKRKCTVKDGFFTISHSQSTRQPVRLNLLTCSVKDAPEEGSKCFNLLPSTGTRVYRFQADDDQEKEAWMSVMLNSKEQSFLAFSNGDNESTRSGSLFELTQQIISEIKLLPGNNVCADCGSAEPCWVSSNLGILLCIECSGVHRELGVHISRIQSLSLDRLSTVDLMLPRFIGNAKFNQVFEFSRTPSQNKPPKQWSMEDRRTFINCKYVQKEFTKQHPLDSILDMEESVYQAIENADLMVLLDITGTKGGLESISKQQDGSLLHVAVDVANEVTLPVLEFLIQRLHSQIDVVDSLGNTPLHVACKRGCIDAVKLLLRANASFEIVNCDGELPAATANTYGNEQCTELLSYASSQTLGDQCQNVLIDWCLSSLTALYSSEEDLEDTSASHTSRRNRAYSGQTPSNDNRHHSAIFLDTTPSVEDSEMSSALLNPTYFSLTKNAACEPSRSKSGKFVKKISHKRVRSESGISQTEGSISSREELDSEFTNTTVVNPQHSKNASPAFVSSKNAPTVPASSYQSKTMDLHSLKRRGSKNEKAPPLPFKSVTKTAKGQHHRRAQAMYDCAADYNDELSFKNGEVIIIKKRTNDPEWWYGEIAGDPSRCGLFPITFVYMLPE